MPCLPIFWDILKVRVLGQRHRGSFCSPARYSGKTVGTVANDCQVVRNRLRPDSEFGDHAGFIAYDLAPAVQLDHSRAHDTLAQILRDEAGVISKFGVGPQSIPDYLAVVGDSADGFPGVAG